MSRRSGLSVEDFQVAPRRKANAPAVDMDVQHEDDTDAGANQDRDVLRAELSAADVIASEPADTGEGRAQGPAPAVAKLPRAGDEERRERVTRRAIEREDSRNAFARLRRSRERESKHFVNVPLDYNTKKRLEKAAYDNDLKQTQIMREAIDKFLTENGY